MPDDVPCSGTSCLGGFATLRIVRLNHDQADCHENDFRAKYKHDDRDTLKLWAEIDRFETTLIIDRRMGTGCDHL